MKNGEPQSDGAGGSQYGSRAEGASRSAEYRQRQARDRHHFQGFPQRSGESFMQGTADDGNAGDLLFYHPTCGKFGDTADDPEGVEGFARLPG